MKYSSRIKISILTCLLLLSFLIQTIPLEYSRAEAPTLIERGRNYEIWKNPDGTYTWRSAPTWIWNGSAYVPYILDKSHYQTDGYVSVQAGLIGAKFYKGKIEYYDPSLSDLRVGRENWLIYKWDDADGEWKPVCASLAKYFDSASFYEAEDYLNITATWLTNAGNLTVIYHFEENLKHTVLWKPNYAGRYAVVQFWNETVYDDVKLSNATVIKRTSDAIIGKADALTVLFHNQTQPFGILEDQSRASDLLYKVMFAGGTLTYQGITITDAVAWIFYNSTYCILEANQILTVDPDTYTASSPTKDAFIHEGNPNTNYGTDVDLEVQSYSTRAIRLLVEFDISSIPQNAYITSATLKLYYYACTAGFDSSRTYRVQRITSSWEETIVTWNNQPSVSSEYVDCTIDNNPPYWWNVTVTSIAQLNDTLGFRIMDTVEDSTDQKSAWFRSKEYDSYDPKLEITYIYVPSIGEFQAPSKIYANKYFYLNATINDADGVNDFVNATVELSNGIILKWDNATDTFSEYQDTNNYCTLDASNSLKSSVNSTAYKLSFKIKLSFNYAEGYLNLTSSNTKVYDSNGLSGSNSWSSSTYFENDLTASSYTVDLANRVLNATIYFEGSTEPAPQGENVIFGSTISACDSNGVASWDLSSIGDFSYNSEIWGSHVLANQTVPLVKVSGHLIYGNSNVTISSVSWDSNDKQLSFSASGNGTQTIQVKHVYSEKPYYIQVDTTVYQEGSHWSWNNTASSCDITYTFSTHTFIVSWSPLESSESSGGGGGGGGGSVSGGGGYTPSISKLPETTEKFVQTVVKPALFKIPEYYVGLSILGVLFVSLSIALRGDNENLAIIIGLIIAIYSLNLLAVWVLEPQGMFPSDLEFLKNYLWRPPSLNFQVVGMPTSQVQLLQMITIASLFGLFAGSIILFARRD